MELKNIVSICPVLSSVSDQWSKALSNCSVVDLLNYEAILALAK